MDSLRAKVDAATSRFREQYKAVGEKAAQAVKQPKSGSKYHSLTTSEVSLALVGLCACGVSIFTSWPAPATSSQADEDGVFTIDEAEDAPVDPSLCVHPPTPGAAA